MAILSFHHPLPSPSCLHPPCHRLPPCLPSCLLTYTKRPHFKGMDHLLNRLVHRDRSPTPFPIVTASKRALAIPEILQAIFQYLCQNHLRLVASLVCKEWRAFSLLFTRLNTLWSEDLSPHDMATFTTQLAFTQTLICMAGEKRSTSLEEGESIRELHKCLMTCPQARRIPAMIVHKGLNLDLFFESSSSASTPSPLPFQHITRLRLQDLTARKIDLRVIMEACPNLEDLAMSASEFPNDIHNTRIHFPRLSVENATNPLPQSIQPRKPLRALTIQYLTVDLTILQRFLTNYGCPALRSLRLVLIRIARTGTLESVLAGFTNAVVQMCPNIECWHFSQRTQQVPYVSMVEMINVMPRTLTTWSMLHADAYPWTFQELQHRRATAANLTTLEIVRDWKPDGSSRPVYRHAPIDLSKELHQFLLQATGLVHLKAEGVALGASQFEIKSPPKQEVLPVPPGYARIPGAARTSASTAATSPPAAENKPLWACHRLKTLHLGISLNLINCRPGILRTHSRIVYAYLATLLPKLEDVKLRHLGYFCTGIESGLCLLTELKELRKLVIVTDDDYLLEREDIQWIKPLSRILEERGGMNTTYAVERMNRWLALEQARIRSGAVRMSIFTDLTGIHLGYRPSREMRLRERDEAIEDRLTRGVRDRPQKMLAMLVEENIRWETVGEIVNGLDNGSRDECWPRLTFFWIRRQAVTEVGRENLALVRTLRPELELPVQLGDGRDWL